MKIYIDINKKSKIKKSKKLTLSAINEAANAIIKNFGLPKFKIYIKNG